MTVTRNFITGIEADDQINQRNWWTNHRQQTEHKTTETIHFLPRSLFAFARLICRSINFSSIV